MEYVSEVIVVGGGIGGLAAALGVVEAGKTVAVLEQAPEFGEVGAGIQLGPNAMAVLDRFGLVEEINKLAVFPKRLVLKDVYTGEELTALDLGEEFQERYGQPYIVMHRSDLHRVLLEACKKSNKITLLNDQSIQSAEQNESGVFITNQRGETLSAKAVIGADGLKSNMRKLFSDDEPICSEYVAYRGTIPINEISSDNNLDDVIMWIGPNLHLVQYPVRRGELYNQVVVFKSFEYKEGSDDWGTPEEMDKRFEGCHPLVVNALSFIQRQIRWPMYDRLPIDNWTNGNITLLGDAAHPMLQYLAQGGCQALEDAACLADELLKNEGDYKSVFQNYQEQRIPRTAKVQTNARTWGEIIHAEDELSILLRNTIFKLREANDFNATDFLYGYHKNLVR
ncbi:FAD-dependent monooxygenase [Domibacillus epiphyticus]|uniref:3-hydroxybenzoate 6-hydroxylase n=1 Tax=Domibacillus epiphyticus TaxID=1714355 RepID=A0A1V2A559_9BACI|nr:FAD-dependent monooxygenase [Domibacillus epiphyticus]OMP65992.1 3-hydroxybenzoate 6-hydroxylase [Domibacillus epiphyticus]